MSLLSRMLNALGIGKAEKQEHIVNVRLELMRAPEPEAPKLVMKVATLPSATIDAIGAESLTNVAEAIAPQTPKKKSDRLSPVRGDVNWKAVNKILHSMKVGSYRTINLERSKRTPGGTSTRLCCACETVFGVGNYSTKKTAPGVYRVTRLG